jgi:hypothetical protein
MRTQSSKIALAATLGLAIAFTLSCSGGDDNDGGGGSNLSELPKQTYILEDGIESEYKGDGYITFRIPYYYDYNCDSSGCTCTDYEGIEHKCERDEYYDRYESKSAGRIRNGQVSLDLPDIKNKYLEVVDICSDRDKGEECNISSPKNLGAFEARFYVTIPGKSECWFKSYFTKDDKMDVIYGAAFNYISKSGKITGLICHVNLDDEYRCTNYDLNFSKGWNVIYIYELDGAEDIVTYDISKTSGTFTWLIGGCDDDHP